MGSGDLEGLKNEIYGDTQLYNPKNHFFPFSESSHLFKMTIQVDKMTTKNEYE